MALSLFKKKDKNTKMSKGAMVVAVPTAPPAYPDAPGPFDAWNHTEIEEISTVSYLIDTCMSVTTKRPIQSVMEAYKIAQGILDHYSGPHLTRPFFISLFLGGIHGMQASARGTHSVRYEREFHGPLMFLYHLSNPLDWTPRPVSMHYTSSLDGHPVEVVFEAKLTATRQTGPNVWTYFEGIKGLDRPNNEKVLNHFLVKTMQMGKNLVFNLDA
ncbi:matrix protein [Lake trout rhabdovirus 903/87]|uniref:Matrix protein n=2 Tax=Perhabdovirus trutta TaxID=179986 RepID=A0A6M3H8S8_9RHAB|nr:matrix protein [Lake trout rhabdovirus 903/87]AAL38517.1 matrix protein [Lake trout rhabdovirus 903/87]QIQ19262.1 matrix [Perhabdovirus trutta]